MKLLQRDERQEIVSRIESDGTLHFEVRPHGYPSHMVRLFDGSYLQELHITDSNGTLLYRVCKTMVADVQRHRAGILVQNEFSRIQQAHSKKEHTL